MSAARLCSRILAMVHRFLSWVGCIGLDGMGFLVKIGYKVSKLMIHLVLTYRLVHPNQHSL